MTISEFQIDISRAGESSLPCSVWSATQFPTRVVLLGHGLGPVPLTYFGLSLGTQYGIPFLAKTDRIKCAALGLFGSHPAPKTPVMNRYAPEVSCPVYFVQKLDDEIHPAESTTHLFATIGSAEKILDATEGKHREVSMNTIRDTCDFLARYDQPHNDG